MTFEEFKKYCSFDITPSTEHENESNILVIFSMAYMNGFGNRFVDSNPDVAKELVEHSLYEYLCKQFETNEV